MPFPVFWTCRRYDLASDAVAVLADFRWLGHTPGLLRPDPSCLHLLQPTARALANGQITLSAADTRELTRIRSGPLGRYFEALVTHVFSRCPDIEALHTNVPVRDGCETMGEFDLLYRRQGRWHHLEMAIKFYLGVGDLTDAFNWHGPALRDTLGRKIRRMQDHQLPLARSVAGKRVLEGLGIDQIASEALVLGRLFQPAANWQSQTFTVPSLVSDDHARGWWYHAGDLRPTPGLRWQKLSKPEWLAPVPDPECCPMGIPGVDNLQQPTQFMVLRENPSGDRDEACRVFVVPDVWQPAKREPK